MLRLILPVIAFLALVIIISSCSSKACSVYTNKSKWKYYNSLQYGGGAKKKSR